MNLIQRSPKTSKNFSLGSHYQFNSTFKTLHTLKGSCWVWSKKELAERLPPKYKASSNPKTYQRIIAGFWHSYHHRFAIARGSREICIHCQHQCRWIEHFGEYSTKQTMELRLLFRFSVNFSTHKLAYRQTWKITEIKVEGIISQFRGR